MAVVAPIVKLRFGRLFVRLGPAPVEDNNVFAIRCGDQVCALRAAAIAENFDSALTFYVELCQAFRDLSNNCWFELRQRRKGIPNVVADNVAIKGYTQSGGLYGDVQKINISSLLNEYWLGGIFRVFGTTEIPASAAVQLATALGEKNLGDKNELPNNLVLVVEKCYHHGDPYLLALFGNDRLGAVRAAIAVAASGLKQPLVEVGSNYFEESGKRDKRSPTSY
jgi:hypothetical protein